MTQKSRIGIVAPSSAVPKVELILGVEKISKAGFEVQVHPQCFKKHLYFAGSDLERAQAFYEYALDPSLPVIWAARGGYGAIRLIHFLERLVSQRGKPPAGKLFLGYSDSTVLFEYVQKQWGWDALHAPMPGLGEFKNLTPPEWNAVVGLINKQKSDQPWGRKKLRFMRGAAPKASIKGEIVGGNLTVLASMIGTSVSPSFDGKILFLEDIGEMPYRLDRVVQQLVQAGLLKKLKALILGDFEGCDDRVPRVLKSKSSQATVPLRPLISHQKVLETVFGSLGECFGYPVAYGLPVGHGQKNHSPLPMGATVELGKDGSLKLANWAWIKK